MPSVDLSGTATILVIDDEETEPTMASRDLVAAQDDIRREEPRLPISMRTGVPISPRATMFTSAAAMARSMISA